jgi:hypothetical protein
MAEPITIGNSANKWIKDANTIGLTYSQWYNTDGTATMYTCPVGKVATVLSVGLSCGSDWNNVQCQVLANGSPIASLTCASGEGNSNSFSMNVYARITAGQTVAFYRANNATQAACGLTVFLVQTDP